MATKDAVFALRDLLSAVPGVASCKVGFEADISPADWPIVRIVSDTETPGRPYGEATMGATIYFGMPIASAEGLEAVYEALLDLRDAITEALRGTELRWRQIVYDSDRITTYKLAAISIELPVVSASA